jgi:cobalt-precorrin-5B (C1)-methyltransferase
LLDRARAANTANEVLGLAAAAGLPLADSVAVAARDAARAMLGESGVAADVLVVDRLGEIVGESG